MSDRLTKFVDVILPLAVPAYFTYRVPFELNEQIQTGQRAVVPFGRGGKQYAAIIKAVHQNPPANYQAKYIDSLLDDRPIVNLHQLHFWDWVQSYYMCYPGDVMSAALPGALRLASETRLVLNPSFEGELKDLSDDEYLVFEALEVREVLSLSDVSQILGIKNVHKVVKRLIEKGVILVEEELKQRYKPKMESFVRLTKTADKEEQLKDLLDVLQKAPKQLEVMMAYLHLSGRYSKAKAEVNKVELQNKAKTTSATINSLVDKGVLEIYEREVGRLGEYVGETESSKELNIEQNRALTELRIHFTTKDVALLHGVTSSGKTEVYIKLIAEAINKGEQVLYLLPEIALTTQLIFRLQKHFGDQVGVYHSKFNQNERVEIWNQVLSFKDVKSKRFQMIVGARSSLFLPYSKLGLIIIDEEHDSSFKQYDPSPRYNARDAAIVLAKMHGAKVLLGSATPSVESYFNAKEGKYGLVEMKKRFGGVQMPEILCADIKEDSRKKKMKSHFSPLLINHMEAALENKEQLILFQNRRGFAPILICESCGHSPQCKNCDVTLTYHKFKNQLSCHYCGYSLKLPNACMACGATNVSVKGFGTEKIEEELSIYFPKAKIGRMDLDTTRSKNAYHTIISDFETGAIDILVGTQMVTKGLDFDNVAVVGILNADNMLNFPDFRAFERAYQLMAQVSGRAGRKQKRGKVIIQTYNPEHPVIRNVIDNNFEKMYSSELLERRNFHYPPFYRIIALQLKHKNQHELNEAATDLVRALKEKFGNRILGPQAPLVGRVKNYYLKDILLKIEREKSINKAKELLREEINKFEILGTYKQLRINIDVDPM